MEHRILVLIDLYNFFGGIKMTNKKFRKTMLHNMKLFGFKPTKQTCDDQITFINNKSKDVICFLMSDTWVFYYGYLYDDDVQLKCICNDDSEVITTALMLIKLANYYKINFYEVREVIHDNDSI